MQKLSPIIGILSIMFCKELIIINDGIVINLMFVSLLMLLIFSFSVVKDACDSLRFTELGLFVKSFIMEWTACHNYQIMCLLSKNSSLRLDINFLKNVNAFQ
jgi:hypothetical protein